MTTQVSTINPFAERHRLRADIQAARVAHDTARGRQQQAQDEHKQADGDLFKAEMDLAVGTEGAQERADDARARSQVATQDAERYGRAVEAASAIGKAREAQIQALYDSDEAFALFCKEAEAATAGAITDLKEVRRALAAAARSWSRANVLWRPLTVPLRNRLEVLNEREGIYPNTASQTTTPTFPFASSNDLTKLAPRPPGIERLRA